jgi:hypothetical protein
VDRVSAAFKGTISVDDLDSEPDWGPFEAPRAPDGAQNVVHVVLDDVDSGGAMGCYGGPIETPTIDRLAAEGARPAGPGQQEGGRLRSRWQLERTADWMSTRRAGGPYGDCSRRRCHGAGDS